MLKKKLFTVRAMANGVFMLSVAMVATLPSGTLAGVPVKYMLLAIITAFFIPLAGRFPRRLIVQFLAVGIFLALHAVHGLPVFGLLAVDELILALGAILLAMIVVHVLARRQLGASGILVLFRLFIIWLAIFKLMILANYVFASDYQAFQVGFLASYQQLTGASFITLPLPYGLVRIYLQHDLLAALFPLAVVALHRRGRLTSADRLLVILAFIIVFLGFSRFNLACYAISLAAFMREDKRDILLKGFIMMGALVAVTVLFKEIWQFIELRFFSAANATSDAIRTSQAHALYALFQEAPMLGHGLGAYTEEVIRSSAAPFSYEQQILSLLPKLGALGFVVVMCYAAYLLWRLIYLHEYHAALFLILFLLASMFNPYLFSSNMVLAYVLIFYFQAYGRRTPCRQALSPASTHAIQDKCA